MSDIDVLLQETRSFPSPGAFRATARVHDSRLHDDAAMDPVNFWARDAGELTWSKPWDTVLEWTPPHAKWFQGGQLNASVNCVDRHIHGPRRNKAAIIWEGEPGDRRTYTYWDLYREVNLAANMLKTLGVVKGDRVAIYLPMIPEAVIAMLACARIGAVHTVVFGGFSPESLRDRINDCGCKVLITADGGYRRGQMLPLKRNADEALKDCPTIEQVLVVMRRRSGVGDETFAEMQDGRDHWWHHLKRQVPKYCEPEVMDAEDLLFILYTSGTTGKPKGIVHTTGGYMTYVYYTTKLVFDLKDEDVYWCTADVGWITGHSYVVYGPLLNGATTVMYEGAPNWPEPDRFWRIVDKYGVTVFYTAPTAIRSFMKWGEVWPGKHRLDSLRLLGTVGEPINPEAWLWYYHVIGKGRCPIVDTWWQTETGGIMITTLPGAHAMKPGHAGKPFFGVVPEILDGEHRPVENPDEGGHLCITRPWPSMLRTVWGDPERFLQQYFSQHPGVYFSGDGAKRDKDGYYMILGRVDDVLNVAGHRLGTMEIESALVAHPAVAEAAVVGRPDPVKGEAIVAFVTLKEGHTPSDALKEELRAHVAKVIGPIARPDEIRFTDALPKTRSGKIMRRLLRQIAAGEKEIKGDTSTLEDRSVVERLKEGA